LFEDNCVDSGDAAKKGGREGRERVSGLMTDWMKGVGGRCCERWLCLLFFEVGLTDVILLTDGKSG
jgi:hypothetical protein